MLGGAGKANGVAVLAVAHQLGGGGGLAPQGAAQLTDDAVDARVQMNVLAYQRRAPAVGTAVAAGLEHVNRTPQQAALEALVVPLDWLAHSPWIRRRPDGSCLAMRSGPHPPRYHPIGCLFPAVAIGLWPTDY